MRKWRVFFDWTIVRVFRRVCAVAWCLSLLVGAWAQAAPARTLRFDQLSVNGFCFSGAANMAALFLNAAMECPA